MAVLDAFRLEGRVAFVPGAGGAIGTAISLALSEAGARIAAANHTRESAEACAEAVRSAGGEAIGLQMDATSEGDCERAVADAVAAFGKVDLVVNCVGGGAGKVLFDAQAYPRDAWDWIMEINVRATVLPTQAAARAMIEAGTGGAVINLSSVRAQLGINAGYSAYVAAKGAVESLTRQWATEWARHGIRVNAIRPTFVDTPQVATLLGDPAFKAGIVGRIPMGRVGTTEDLVGAVIFLASDAAGFITGQVIGIDGGLTATQ
jgi:NAD(P)-dependent dehydrogenase (short-subunit alcohol dehydrogenase family)